MKICNKCHKTIDEETQKHIREQLKNGIYHTDEIFVGKDNIVRCSGCGQSLNDNELGKIGQKKIKDENK